MRRRGILLPAATVLAAALVVGTAATAAVSLSGGFERSAEQADLPDVIVRFASRERAEVDARLSALPNVVGRSYRTEVRGVPIAAGGGSSERGAVHVVEPGRRGYAIVDGRDVRGPDDAVIEAGVARAWDVEVGDDLRIGGRRARRIVGISRSPDNVAYPLARAPRVYVAGSGIPARFRPLRVNVALAWLRDPAHADATLVQARAVSFGLEDLRFVTRAGVQVLIGQAAGIVIALLVAFSAVAVATAGVMLGASARSDVARRLPVIAVHRAVGFSRGRVVLDQVRRATLVAAPAAAAGLAIGALAMRSPAERLLAALNEVGPGAALLLWLAGAWFAIVAVVALASAWPAWRATAGPVAALLRGGELALSARPRRHIVRRGLAGFGALGARLAIARRIRWATTVAVLAAASATLVLLLALASVLSDLRDDPGAVGKRYDVTARIGADRVRDVEALPGVADAAPRWTVEASAAYALGQPLRLVAFPRGDGDLEAPPLAEGRRRRSPDEAEVGSGLADALGLRPGSTLAVTSSAGEELRFAVSGVVRALENEGRVAFVDAEALPEAALGDPVLAVAVEPGADRAAVSRGLAELGAVPAAASAATTRDRTFLGVLATVLRIVAVTVALVCLVVLAQALVLTVRERRPTIALLRATGAGRAALARVLAGACAAVLVPAAVLGVLVEWLVLGPAVSSMAAGYAGLSLAPRPGHLALAAVGLALLGLLAVGWVGRQVVAEPVVTGLREPA